MFFIKGICGFEFNILFDFRVNKVQSDFDGFGFGVDLEDLVIFFFVYYLGFYSGY